MSETMEFVPMDNENLKDALEIAQSIFYKDTENIQLCYDQALLPKDQRMPEMRDCYGPIDYFLVKAGCNYVGVTGLYVADGQAFLAWFGISKAFRNKGYGAAALQKTIDLARDRGFSTLRLFTTPEDYDTDPAVRLYRRMGFTKQDTDYIYKEKYKVFFFGLSLNDEPYKPFDGDFDRVFAYDEAFVRKSPDASRPVRATAVIGKEEKPRAQ